MTAQAQRITLSLGVDELDVFRTEQRLGRAGRYALGAAVAGIAGLQGDAVLAILKRECIGRASVTATMAIERVWWDLQAAGRRPEEVGSRVAKRLGRAA